MPTWAGLLLVATVVAREELTQAQQQPGALGGGICGQPAHELPRADLGALLATAEPIAQFACRYADAYIPTRRPRLSVGRWTAAVRMKLDPLVKQIWAALA